MTITITLNDELVAGLERKAKEQQKSVEQLALRILAAAADECATLTPEEVVARIQTTPPNPSQIRPALGNLADVLRAAPSDPSFDLASWQRQWAIVENQMKALTQANDAAEGLGQ